MNNLKRHLDSLTERFDLRCISPDPLEFLHKFKDPGDREVVGLIASSLAYGQVGRILFSINRVMELMEWRPYDFTVSFEPERDKRLFNGFKHRFNDGNDLACLIYFAKQMIRDYGSIKGFFLKGYHPEDENIGRALSNFSEAALGLESEPVYHRGVPPKETGVRFFFPSPRGGSPCKRLNLYLRWMVRSGDGIDFGLWREISPAQLIIPLDTHIARISSYIGLTTRSTPGWRMAEEITENLKTLDPADPVRYDFALCRLGILEYCTRKRNPVNCGHCPIKEICTV